MSISDDASRSEKLRNQNSTNSGIKLHENSLNVKNNTSEYTNKILVETLKELVEPKEFKDIFFDDDDFSEGSTAGKDQLIQ